MTTHAHTDERVVFGFWLYLMSDCVLFGTLFATFAVLREATFGAAGASELSTLSFLFTETLILLISSLSIGLALLAAKLGKRTLALAGLAATFVLGASFLGMELNEFSHLIAEGNGPAQSAFLSAFFTLVGTHGLHVFMGLVWMLVVTAHLAVRGLEGGVVRKLTQLSLFWHFLDIIWIFIFTFVYLFGMVAV
jgi:cytochrome o ubiquinol oxidase subunit 3